MKTTPNPANHYQKKEFQTFFNAELLQTQKSLLCRDVHYSYKFYWLERRDVTRIGVTKNFLSPR